jgi:hypothetical protein
MRRKITYQDTIAISIYDIGDDMNGLLDGMQAI